MKVEIKQNVIIIGNGFDLNLGLKTSYKDFIESNYFTGLLDNPNKLALHIQNKQELEHWVDIEAELLAYSKSTKDANFIPEYKAIKQALIEHLTSLNLADIDKNAMAYNFIKNCPEKTVIYNFNYTKSVLKILAELPEQTRTTIQHNFVHGSIDDGIVFGVQDTSNVKDKHVDILKSVDINFKALKVLNSSKIYTGKVSIFGHSLGESDRMYFSGYFSSIKEEYSNKKEIDIYHYGENGRKDIINQIRHMTYSQFAKLRQNNRVKFIDNKFPMSSVK